MTNKKVVPSLQDILRKRQQAEFVGREEQLADFRANLRYDLTDDRRKFIFNIFGQGGVGKTWLAQRLCKIAEEQGGVTAWSDDAETDVPSAMGRIAEQLDEQGHQLKVFSERYKVYRQRKQELEADPDAPQGLTASVTRTLVDVGIDVLNQTPVGIVTKRLPKDLLATQAGEWAEFVRRKLANKDETRLVLEPIEVLTPLWVAGLAEIAEVHPLALFFDTFERSDEYLDAWLRQVLDGRHGSVAANIVWTISGRDALDENNWAQYRGLISRVPLEPFSEEEAREYLGGKDITKPKIVEVIMHLSGRLPLLVATLAAQSPSNTEQLEDPSDTAVERFLKWVDDPVQRRTALDGALPRHLNRDILTCIIDAGEAEPLFAWLQTMPFIQKKGDRWVYHDVVRNAMLRYLRAQSPRTWSDLHRQLAEHFEMARTGLVLDEKQARKDSAWQELAIEILYHRLCQISKANLPDAINGFLTALSAQRDFGRKWAAILRQAGEDSSAPELTLWGKRLAEGVTAIDGDRHESAIDMFTALLQYPVLEQSMRPVALDWRGRLYSRLNQYDQAVADFTGAIGIASAVAKYWQGRGIANLQRGDYANALRDFDQAIVLEPENAWTFAFRGLTNVYMNRGEAALSDVDHAIEFDPDNGAAIFIRGITNRQMGCYEAALSDFDRAIELIPDSAQVIAFRGSTYSQMGRYEAALSDFDRAIELIPDNAQRFIDRGSTYSQMGRYEAALSDFDRAIELDSNNAQRFIDRGSTYSQMGRYEAALSDFDRTIEFDPDNGAAIFSRGITNRRMGRYEAALSDFDRSIELIPDNAQVIAFRGSTYGQMGRYEAALSDFDRAIELDPNDAQSFIDRGSTYSQMGRYEAALSDFDRAIELNPDDTQAIVNRGETYSQMGRYEAALSNFDRAIELDPDNAQVINSRGLVLSYFGRYEDAIDAYEQSLQGEADHAVLYNIAVATVRWKGLDLASPTIKKAVRALENSSASKPGAALYGLGGLAALRGDSQRALDYLRRAIPLEDSARAWAAHDTAWLDLRTDPDFQTLLHDETSSNRH